MIVPGKRYANLRTARARRRAATGAVGCVSFWMRSIAWVWVLAAFCVGAGLWSVRAADPVAKVVRRYALTSANDFPERDPQSWRLLASPDGGRTWVTLDTRRGEVFSERHQRRVFQLNNHQAFDLYRLQIDRVLDPAAATCVQLAEVEPLGDTDDDIDLVPTAEDVITVRGENPPVETRFAAFDSQVETKWLDYSDQPATRASWIQWRYMNQASGVITNVKQLLSLRARAGRSYPVRIEGVVAGQRPGADAICFLDATGPLDIPVLRTDAGLAVGQKVVLTGYSQWTNRLAGVRDCRLQARGPNAAATPRPIALEQPLTLEDELAWVEAEGTIQFPVWVDNNLVFELHDGDRSLPVRVLHPEPAAGAPVVGARVRVRGICEGALDESGRRVAGTLWVPALDAISPANPVNTSTNAPDRFTSETPAGGTATVLTHIKQIRHLSWDRLVGGPRVKVRAVVTEVFGAFVQEDSAGIEVWYGDPLLRTNLSFGSLIEVEGRGDWAIGHGPIIRAETVRALGKGRLPPAERYSWSQLASGRGLDQWVEIEGVVRSTDGSHLLVSCEGGDLMATIRSAPAPQVKRLVDATVRVRGVSVEATDSRGRALGIQVVVPSLEFVEIEQPAVDPASLVTRSIGSLLQGREPKEFPHRVKVEGVLTLREGRHYFLQDSTGGAMATGQENVVLKTPAGGWNWIFLQSSSSNAEPVPPVNVGDRLEVIGFPEMRGYSPVLTEALVRKIGSGAPVSPVKATAQDLVGGTLDSTLVSLEASLLRREVLGPDVVLELQSDSRVFQAFLRADRGSPLSIEPGSRVRVTGVCQLEALPYAELGKRVASFKLLIGAPSDLVVLSRPLWWTLKRALAVTGILVVVLAIAAAWIGILRRQVEKQTRRLQEEIAEHKQTEARLAQEKKLVQAEFDERKRAEAEVERSQRQLLKASRLAGMAEVATSVLHNVGNVLNSANVLASVIVEHVRTSKVASVGKLAALLGEHRAELGHFVTDDERGQHLPGYLERLAGHLAEEQSRLLEKVKLLTESLQHIKEIVAMQQNYAKASGIVDQVAMAEIVEDALRMHNEALARHQIRVVREFAPVPVVTIDRHKVLQILFNLLENAKHACDEGPSGEKQVTVVIRQNGDARIQVAVRDNGVGISPENLPRIFGQAFSTRRNGHGFGLHSSILAAQDMGGTLRAQSDGPGRGAMFTLEVPITVPPAGH